MRHLTHNTRCMKRRGFTLIETLVWIAIFVFAMGALIVSLLSFYDANTYTLAQAQAISDARRGIEGTVKIIREASIASDGAFPVVSIGEHSFTLYSDIDDDPQIERVRFFIEGTDIVRGVLKPSGSPLAYIGVETESVLSGNIRNLDQGVTTFRYYDEAGGEIIDYDNAAGARFVEINLVVNVSPERLPNELTIRSSATLRNIK